MWESSCENVRTRVRRRSSGALEASGGGRSREADGQLAVRPEAVLEHQVVPRDSSWLDAELPLLDLVKYMLVAVVRSVPRSEQSESKICGL